MKFTGKLPKIFLSGLASFYGYQAYHELTAPKPYDFSKLPEKRKIVIVGSGLAGLSAAYYLPRMPIITLSFWRKTNRLIMVRVKEMAIGCRSTLQAHG